MTRGIVIFAHNSVYVDYILTALTAATLASHYLKVPVSLITDESTLGWAKQSGIYNRVLDTFDTIIEIDRPSSSNTRILHDGASSKSIPFINSSRSSVWDLTPYDRTLVIDSDFLVYSDTLSTYWDADYSIMLASSMNDIRGDRQGILDIWVSGESIPLLWATTVMFTKDRESQLFFNLVSHIKDNYPMYAVLYKFDPTIYRNDIAFSIANHMLHGFVTDSSSNLPPILTTTDKDLIHTVHKSGLQLLIQDPMSLTMNLVLTSSADIHVINKEAIVRVAYSIMEQLS